MKRIAVALVISDLTGSILLQSAARHAQAQKTYCNIPWQMIYTEVTGPQCVPFQGSAYLWWDLESLDRRQG